MGRWRNLLAKIAANWILNHIATPWYRDRVSGYIQYGMNAAARDEKEGIPAPEHWTTYVDTEENA
ncbi:hypothetical protein [Corynebacterium sp. CNJ-954]|uniref:hypothetical protein n=1 Tax=Corynebacterium sp. CNJ-954 TaxID=1904962 RepID=UPI00111543F1|nr:hypothetical protein [Corynebacterium sp. CNJ-954]